MVFKKGMALSPLHARQLIVHGHVTIGERVITIPGYQVGHDEESTVAIRGTAKGGTPAPEAAAESPPAAEAGDQGKKESVAQPPTLGE